MHPGYNFTMWTDAVAGDFVAREYPNMIKTWQSYRYTIQKADSIRYMIMYKYGGTSTFLLFSIVRIAIYYGLFLNKTTLQLSLILLTDFLLSI